MVIRLQYLQIERVQENWFSLMISAIVAYLRLEVSVLVIVQFHYR